MPDRIDLEGYSVTVEEAQMAILEYLRDVRGEAVSMWKMLNVLCTHPSRSENRKERRFYLAQLTRLINEKKVIRYDRRFALRRGHPVYGQPKHYLGLNNKIRISEAWV
jgi:hypothetical protein